MRWWVLCGLLGAAALDIDTLDLAADSVLRFHVDSAYFANDQADIALPFLSLGQRSLCQPFAQSALVNDGVSFTSSSFSGTWGAFLTQAFNVYQNPPRFISSMLVQPNWVRYEGYWEDGHWVVAQRGRVRMTLREHAGGVRYEIEAPVKDLGELGIALTQSGDHYEAILVLSVLLLRRNEAGYFAQCTDERVHINTKQGFNVVKVYDAEQDEVEAYFHGVPRWVDSGANRSCTPQSERCHVAFVVAAALRRGEWDKRKVVARIVDLSAAFSPHDSVSLHGAVFQEGMPRDVYFIHIDTPSVDAPGLFVENRECAATAALSEYGFDLATAECVDTTSVQCGIGKVLGDGSVNGIGAYNQTTLRHRRVEVAFQWNACPEASTSNLAINLDARFLLYDKLSEIKSIVDTGMDYVPAVPFIYPGSHLYADFRVLLPSPENVTLKFHSVVLRDSKGGKKYTLVENYTTVKVYADELHRQSCWSDRSPYGTCALPAAHRNPALRQRANGEAFDVIQVLAPQWTEDHTWSIMATALLIHGATNLSQLPPLRMPTDTELETTNTSIVKFTAFFHLRKPEAEAADEWGSEEYLLGTMALLLSVGVASAIYFGAFGGRCGCDCGCGCDADKSETHRIRPYPHPRIGF